MNIFEIAAFIFNSIIAFMIGRILYAQYGIMAGLCGVIVGYLLGVCILKSTLLVAWFWDRIFLSLPLCRRGVCTARHYKRKGTMGDGILYVCACGDRYLKRGQRLFEIGSDDTLKLYMRYDGHNWVRSDNIKLSDLDT